MGIFTHLSSPILPTSQWPGRKICTYVQIVKLLITKADETNSDPYLSLLEYRNTIIDNLASSAQMLMSQHLQSVLPRSLLTN